MSNAELYKALFTMDQRLGERDTALINMVGTLRRDFSVHTQDGHPWNQAAEVVIEKSKVDGKKYGALAATAGLLTLVASAISAALDKWVY